MTKQIREYLEHLRLFLDGEHSREEYMQEMKRLHVIFFLMTLFMALIQGSIGIYVLALLFLVLLIPYIKHYYFLENSVQKMYLIYNKLEQLSGGKDEL